MLFIADRLAPLFVRAQGTWRWAPSRSDQGDDGRSEPGKQHEDEEPGAHETAPERRCSPKIEKIEHDPAALEGGEGQQQGVSEQWMRRKERNQNGCEREPDQRDPRHVETVRHHHRTRYRIGNMTIQMRSTMCQNAV